MNKDAYFDNDVVDISDGDGSFEEHSASKTGVSSPNNGTQIGHTGIEPRKQMSRIEAKLDSVVDVMNKIQRMMISMTIRNNSNSTIDDDSNANHNIYSMFPLTTEESMDQFEKNLDDHPFRRMVVRIDINFVFIFAIQNVACPINFE